MPFGIEHPEGKADRKGVFDAILARVDKLIPHMGAPLDHHLIYWRESPVSKNLSTGAGYQGEVVVFPTRGVHQDRMEETINGDGSIGGKMGQTRESMVVLAGD